MHHAPLDQPTLRALVRPFPDFAALLDDMEPSKWPELLAGCSLLPLPQGHTIFLFNSKLAHTYLLLEGSVLATRFGLNKQEKDKPLYPGSSLPKNSIVDQAYFLGSRTVSTILLPGAIFGFLGNEMNPRSGYDFLAETDISLLSIQSNCFLRTLIRQYVDWQKKVFGFLRNVISTAIPASAYAQYQFHIRRYDRKKGQIMLARGQSLRRPFVVERGQVLVCDLLPGSNFVQKRHKILQPGRLIYLQEKSKWDLLSLTELSVYFLEQQYFQKLCVDYGLRTSSLACDLSFQVDMTFVDYLAQPSPRHSKAQTFEEQMDRKVWQLQYKRDIMHDTSCRFTSMPKYIPEVFILPEDANAQALKRRMDHASAPAQAKKQLPRFRTSPRPSDKSSPEVLRTLGLILQRLGHLPTIHMQQKMLITKRRVNLPKNKYRYFEKRKAG